MLARVSLNFSGPIAVPTREEAIAQTTVEIDLTEEATRQDQHNTPDDTDQAKVHIEFPFANIGAVTGQPASPGYMPQQAQRVALALLGEQDRTKALIGLGASLQGEGVRTYLGVDNQAPAPYVLGPEGNIYQFIKSEEKYRAHGTQLPNAALLDPKKLTVGLIESDRDLEQKIRVSKNLDGQLQAQDQSDSYALPNSFVVYNGLVYTVGENGLLSISDKMQIILPPAEAPGPARSPSSYPLLLIEGRLYVCNGELMTIEDQNNDWKKYSFEGKEVFLAAKNFSSARFSDDLNNEGLKNIAQQIAEKGRASRMIVNPQTGALQFRDLD